MKCIICKKEVFSLVENDINCWGGAAVDAFMPGYGSIFDSMLFNICLCDKCIQQLIEDGSLNEIC